MMRLGLGLRITDQQARPAAGGVYEDSLIIRPNGYGDGSSGVTLYGSAGSRWEAMSDVTEVTGVRIAGFEGAGWERYAMANLPGDALAVNQVNARIRARRSGTSGSATIGYTMKLGGSVIDSVQKTVTQAAPGVFGDYHVDWSSVARPGGGSWSVADVNAILYGIKSTNVGFSIDLDLADCWLQVWFDRPL